ncbi:MAG: MATE family efflux transporter [Candidatus Wallbacteria bacterium]
MENQKNSAAALELKTQSVGKLLLKYSIPTIVGMMVFAFYNIIDRIFIGRAVGSMGIAAVGITYPIFMILIAFGMLVGIGAGTLVSIKLGAGHRDEAEKILGNALTVLIILSVISTIAGLFYLENILLAFGASQNTLGYACDFMRIIFLGIIFSFVAMGLNNVIRAEGNPGLAMGTMLIGSIINILLNPLFIFVFKLGVAGSALATLVSNLVSSAWVIWHFTRGKSNIKLRARNMVIEFSIIKQIFFIGLSPFITQLAGSVVGIAMNKNMLLYGGDIGVSALGIISGLTMSLMMPIIGISQGAQPIIGFNYGAGEYARVKKAINLSCIWATAISALVFTAAYAAPEFIIKIFDSRTPELITVGTHGMKIFMIGVIFLGFQIVGTNYFQAVGKPKTSIFLTMLRQIILLVPFVYIFPYFWKLDGLWLAMPAADIITSAVVFFVLSSEMKRLRKEI